MIATTTKTTKAKTMTDRAKEVHQAARAAERKAQRAECAAYKAFGHGSPQAEAASELRHLAAEASRLAGFLVHDIVNGSVR